MRAATILAVMVLGAATPQLSAAQATPASTPNAVVFRNALPKSYRLVKVRLIVDGKVKFDGPMPFNYQLPPGDHLVDVVADYRLNDPLFTYMRDYAIELRSTNLLRQHSRPITLMAVARERGNATTPLSKRAVIHWQTVVF